MTDASIKRQKEKERRERLARVEERLAAEQREQRRQAELKTQWPRVLAARAQAQLAGYQAGTYFQKALRLLALDKAINGD